MRSVIEIVIQNASGVFPTDIFSIFSEKEDIEELNICRRLLSKRHLDINEMVKLIDEQKFQRLETYTQAIMALVNTIIMNEEGPLFYQCCGILMFWPKEYLIIEDIKLAIIDAAIKNKRYIVRYALRQLLQTQADLKPNLISKLETCDDKNIPNVLEFFETDYKNNGNILSPEVVRILVKRLPTAPEVGKFIEKYPKCVYISFDSAIELLKSCKYAPSFLNSVASVHFKNEDLIKFINEMLDVNSRGIDSLVLKTNNLTESPYFYEIIKKVITSTYATSIFNALKLDLTLLKQLMAQYPNFHGWLPSMYRFTDDKDIEAYIDSSLGNEQFMLALTALHGAQNVTPFVPKLCTFLPQCQNDIIAYDTAISILSYKKLDLTKYLPTIIPYLIENMEESGSTAACLARLLPRVNNKREFAREIIPHLLTAEYKTVEHAQIAAELCEFDDFANELVMYFDEIHANGLDGKPLSLVYVKHMFLKLLNGNDYLDHYCFGNLLDNPKAKKLEYYITDAVVCEMQKPNKEIYLLWHISEKLQSEYAQHYAWQDPKCWMMDYCIIYRMLRNGQLIVPPDETAQISLNLFLDSIKSPLLDKAKTMVFLYNNTSALIN